MRFDHRLVDDFHFIGTDLFQGFVKTLPESPSRPAAVTIIDRCGGPIDGRTVSPMTTCLQNMKDAADDTAVVHSSRTRLVPRKMGLDR
jgi:hypothetical protein